jgi:hypothetical protein
MPTIQFFSTNPNLLTNNFQGKVQWFIDKLLKKPINSIMNKFGVNNLINTVNAKLVSAVGVDDLQSALDNKLNELEPLILAKLQSLDVVSSESNPNSLLGLVNGVSRVLE